MGAQFLEGEVQGMGMCLATEPKHWFNCLPFPYIYFFLHSILNTCFKHLPVSQGRVQTADFARLAYPWP